MSGIRTLNLMWRRRIRGIYPVARFALADDGALAVAVPRPLEARTYDLTHLALDGGVEQRGGFAVETLLRLEASPLSDSLLGMTADDLYLFHEGEKRRFLGLRRLLYIDAALSADGKRLTTIFSDIGGSNFALAYGEIGGRTLWMCDLDLQPAVVTISRNGIRVVIGAESGQVQLIDAAMRDVWEFGQPEPVRALAGSADGVAVAYGTKLGGVGLLGGDGSRQWEARLPGEVTALALPGDGSLCAALCRPEGEAGANRLFCISGDGQIAWEYEAEQPLVGLSISPNGRYLATGTRAGEISIYEIVPGRSVGRHKSVRADELRAKASELEEADDVAGACVALEEALTADPGDVETCERWIALRGRLHQVRKERAKICIEAEDPAGAIEALEAALQDELPDPEAVQMLIQARRQVGRQHLERAQSLLIAVDEEQAESELLAALAVAPDLSEARRALRDLRQRHALSAEREADQLLAAEQFEEAVAALERAQEAVHDEERNRRLESARVAMEFAAGMTAYSARRYPEAIFQFRKALLRDPDHAEAKRYLAFAQKFARDSDDDSLSERFSHLE